MFEGILIEVVAIAVCLVLSALFSGSETALTSLHAGKIEQMIGQRRPGGKILVLWRDSPALILSFLLVANNTINILASSLATELSIKVLLAAGVAGAMSLAVAIAVGVVTLLILLFGEVTPKTFFRSHPHRIQAVLPVLLVFYYVTYPLAKAFGSMARGMLTLAGTDALPRTPSITEEELSYLIQKGRKEGSLDKKMEEMLTGVLHLQDRIAREVMVPRTQIVMFDAQDPLPKVMEGVAEHKFSRYPVYQFNPDNVIGFFYAKDLLAYFQLRDKRQPFKLRNFVRPPYFVPETKRLDELLREFQREHVHVAVVVDEYGGTSGLIALEDVLEEMVGEIYDEYDQEESLYSKVDATHFLADARLPVDELRETLGIPVTFPEDREYETVAGLAMELAGRVPPEGEELDYTPEGEPFPALRIKVLKSDGVKVSKVRIEVLPPPAE